MNKLRIITWNIRQGGKKAIRQIVDTLVYYHADLIVLTEYKNNDAGVFLIAELKKKGWPYIHSSRPPNRENGILIVSKYLLKEHPPSFSREYGSHRWKEVYFPALQLFLLGVHVPNINETYNKSFFWEQIVRYSQRRRNDQAILIGDFNTARRDEKKNAPLKYSNFIMNLMKEDWVDAWKQQHKDKLDYTWLSHKNNGFRLDYLFLSPELSDRLDKCELLHGEREKNFSDHSILIAEIEGKSLD